MAQEAQPARVPAQQARSRRTERAILEATRELLEEGKPFDAVSMAGIARRAGVSIGGLYGRFPGGKAGLLQVLYRELLEDWTRTLAGELPDGQAGEIPLPEVVGRYVHGMVRAFHRDRPLLVAVYHARTTRTLDPAIAANIKAFDHAAHARFLRFTAAALPGDLDPERVEPVLRFALLQLSAAARAAILEGAADIYGLPAEPDGIAEPIIDGALAYIARGLDLG